MTDLLPNAPSTADRIRNCARLACEPARTELRKIADEIEREGKRVTNDHRAEERNA